MVFLVTQKPQQQKQCFLYYWMMSTVKNTQLLLMEIGKFILSREAGALATAVTVSWTRDTPPASCWDCLPFSLSLQNAQKWKKNQNKTDQSITRVEV